MLFNNQQANHLVNDPVPRNVSKFPIHQTYLSSDSERTSQGGYKFKCPEVWSSARSGKKSIAIRSITWKPKQISLSFNVYVHKVSDGDDTTNDLFISYDAIIAPFAKTQEIIAGIQTYFDTRTLNQSFAIDIQYKNNQLTFQAIDISGQHDDYVIGLTKNDIEKDATNTHIISCSFDEIFNQPYSDNDGNLHDLITLNNVWDRYILNFHASFIPFDNYQYLGDLGDKWNNPIIYQDPNTSPLFNVWTTTDMKTSFPILHEDFIFRFTFIISSESQYHS